jgi:hypothetical protein
LLLGSVEGLVCAEAVTVIARARNDMVSTDAALCMSDSSLSPGGSKGNAVEVPAPPFGRAGSV